MSLQMSCNHCGDMFHMGQFNHKRRLCRDCSAKAADAIRHDEPPAKTFSLARVRAALMAIRHTTAAIRALEREYGASPMVRAVALRQKTKALIRHDRILRGEL